MLKRSPYVGYGYIYIHYQGACVSTIKSVYLAYMNIRKLNLSEQGGCFFVVVFLHLLVYKVKRTSFKYMIVNGQY